MSAKTGSFKEKHRYKLVYFDIKGRAEPIRLLFKYFDVPFEEIKIAPKDWPKKRAKTPLRFLPYIDVDDGRLQLASSPAIMRYLAKSFSPGTSKTDAARVDMYGEGAIDLFDVFMTIGMATTEEERRQTVEEATPRLELFCEAYSQHLKKNGGPYINGKTLTWADLVIAFVLSAIDDLYHDLLKKNKELVRYYLRMREVPEISEHIKNNWRKTTLKA